MSKTALIVDDSPLARHVLSQLLSEHGIKTDTAPSAEEALDYLKQRRPDVVFMDHLMPGMDGFEALEAIKANPATATIPVMMYTSQEGELYVGQARALGAFGVLPKDLKPVEVARVLRALHLIPGEAGGEAGAPVRAAADTADSQRVKALLEELFYQQRSALREEIREGYQRAIETTRNQLDDEPTRRVQPITNMPWRIAAGVLLFLAVVFGYLYLSTSRLLEQVNVRSTQLVTRNAQLNTLNATSVEAFAAADPESFNGLLSGLEWAVNLSGGYAFGDVPLDDARAQLLSRLIEYLEASDFSGSVVIEVHVGQFCMNAAADGTWQLAADDQPAQSCQQIGWSGVQSEALGRRQSLGFANTIATSARSGRIDIRTTSIGSEEPLLTYPSLTNFVTAGEWNEIAAGNQRVDVRLIPD